MNNWGVVSSATNKIISGGLDKFEAENIAQNFSKQYKFPFGITEYQMDKETSGLKFDFKNVNWVCNSLFEEWKMMLVANPYLRFNKHKSMIVICCCDIDYNSDNGYNDDEIICIMEKKECKRLAKLICGVEDFDNWIKNEYTSDQSEAIISTAIKNGKVLTVYKCNSI